MSDLPRGAPRPAPLSRRDLLAGGAALTAATVTMGLAGCEATSNDGSATTAAPTEPLTPVLLGQQVLLATYERTLAAFPELSPAVSDLQGQSVAHTGALLQAAPAAAAQVAAAAAGSTATTAAPSSAPPASAPATDSTSAVADLARAVDTAASSLRAAALRASGELAALLGSCAASTACHARLLGL